MTDSTAEFPYINNIMDQNEEHDYLNTEDMEICVNNKQPKDAALHKFFVAMYKTAQKLPDNSRENIKAKILNIVNTTRDLVKENYLIKRSLLTSDDFQTKRSKKLITLPTTNGSSTPTADSENTRSELNTPDAFSNLSPASYIPIPSTSKAKTTVILRDQLLSDLPPNKESKNLSILPVAPTPSTSNVNMFSNEIKIEQITYHDLNTSTMSSSKIASISFTPDVQRTVLPKGKRIETKKEPQPTKTSQDKEGGELSSRNCLSPTTDSASIANLNTSENTPEIGNIKKELDPVDNSVPIQLAETSTNPTNTLENIKVEKPDVRDEDVLSLCGSSCSDVLEVMSVHDVKIEVSDGE